jgi:hypothetical protein
MSAPHSLSELSTSRQFSPFYDELKPILYIMRVLGLWSTPDASALTRVVFPALLCIVFLIGPWAALFIHLIDSDISRTGVFSGTFEIPLMMLNIVATATFFFVRRYLDGQHLSELIVCTFHHNTAEHVLSAPPSPSYRSLPLQSVPQDVSDDATERTDVDVQFATLANFRARAQLEIRAWIVFEVLALASFIPFSVYHTNDSPSIVLVVYQTCQRMYTFSIYSIYMRLFSLVRKCISVFQGQFVIFSHFRFLVQICSCHCLDVEEHIARYKLAIQSKLFSPAVAFNLVEPITLTIRIKMLCDAVEQFFNDLMSDYIRIGKISRGTSNNFRAFVGLSLLVSFVEAIISVYLYVSTSSDPNSSQTWLDFWLLIPCLLHFLISSAALYSAAKVQILLSFVWFCLILYSIFMVSAENR